ILTDLAGSYLKTKDEVGPRQAMRDLVLNIEGLVAFVGVAHGGSKLLNGIRSGLAGTEVGPALDNVITNADTVKVKVNLDEYKTLANKVDTGKATLDEEDALKAINKAAEDEHGRGQILKTLNEQGSIEANVPVPKPLKEVFKGNEDLKYTPPERDPETSPDIIKSL